MVIPCAWSVAIPTPPRIARSGPSSLPTEAPAPAPTLPSAASATGTAAAQARAPLPGVRADGVDRPRRGRRSRLPATSGTRAGPTSTPRPCASSQRITPPAASRPKALPPAQDDGVHARHGVDRVQQVGLPGAGGGAAHVDPGGGPVGQQDDGDPCGAALVGVVPDQHAGECSRNQRGVMHDVIQPRRTGACRAGQERVGGRVGGCACRAARLGSVPWDLTLDVLPRTPSSWASAPASGPASRARSPQPATT